MSRRAGGLFESVRKRALHFHALGHAVRVISLRDEFSASDMQAWSPLKPTLLETFGGSGVGFAPELSRTLAQDRADILHQHGVWQAFSAAVSTAGRRSQIPVVISPHGMLDKWAVRNSAWKKRIAYALYERRNLSNSSCLHALNKAEADSMRAFGLTNPIAVIPNGADIQDVISRPKAPDWWPKGRVLLFLGRIHPKKGISELIEAFARFSAELPVGTEHWSLVIAGWDDGGHQAVIELAIQNRGLTGQVLSVGPLFGPAKDAAYANAAAFVLPSYSEGLPMTVLEAWSWGVPVLMTSACNLPDGFTSQAAFEITTDPAQLARALYTMLLQEPSQLKKMGVKGRTLAERNYSWEAIAAKHIEVYRWQVASCPSAETPSCVQLYRGGVSILG